MLFDIRICLTSELLGEQRQGEVRRLRRESKDVVSVPLAHWQWAFQEAAETMHLPINPATLSPEPGIRCPTIVLYRRTYTHKGVKQAEMFEAVRKGAQLSFQLATLHHVQNTIPPNVGDVQKLMIYVGKFIGISQWGNQYGFGRFEVLDINQI